MLADKYINHRFILASQSPRRQELLSGLDIDFDIITRPVEEIYNQALKGTEITDYLSQLKAGVFNDLGTQDILITSDTIVWSNDRALGKPKNSNEAIEMLQELSGKSHQVHTSVCFTTHNDQWTVNDTTTVFFNEMSDMEISYYVDNYSPMDRAGSYGIQDWLGYSNVETFGWTQRTLVG